MGFSSGTWTSTTESSSCKQASRASDHHCSTSHSSLSFFLVSGFFSAPNGNQHHLHTLTRTPISVVFLLLSHKTKKKQNPTPTNKWLSSISPTTETLMLIHKTQTQNDNLKLLWVWWVLFSLDLSGCIPK